MKHSTVSFPGKRIAVATLLALALAACGEKPEVMIASARDYMAKNDLKAAVIQVKNALQENPELPEARYILGLALLRGGDPVGAETELRKARALSYPDDKTIPPLAQAMLLQGQFNRVTEDFSGILLTEPAAKAEFLTSLASAHLALNNGNLAEQALTAALAADPTYAPALLLKARALGAERKYDEALALVDAILDKDAKNFEGWKLKGDLLQFGKDQTTEAQAAYRKSVAISPGYVLAHSAILRLLFKHGDIENAGKQLDALKNVAPNHPQTRYFDTLLAFQLKDLKLARELSQQLIKVLPNNLQSLVLAGAIALQSNSLVQAEDYLAKASQAAPEFLLARMLLTTTYLRGGQPEKALSTLQPALKDDDPGAGVNALAGEVYLQTGDINKAEAYFSKAAKQEPENTRSRTALALTHLAGGKDSGFGELQSVAATDSGITADLALISVQLRRGEFDKALAAIAALEKKQPDKPLASNLRGRTLLAKKDIAGARKAFESSIVIDPTFFPSAAGLAAMDIADKKIDSARKRFDAVLAKNPQHVQALLALAELRAREGAPKAEVAELITKAVDADPSEPMPRQLLIDFHLKKRDMKLALSAAQNAVATIPNNADLLDALGRSQQAVGNDNQALATFNKLVTMQPNSPLPHMRIAQIQLKAKNKSAAARSLRDALDAKADHLAAQRGLYLLAMDGKNYQEATTIARTIQKQRPTHVMGFQFEGDALRIQKKWDAAAEVYRRALKLSASPELATKLHSTLNANGQGAEADKLAANWLKEYPKDIVYPLYLANIALVRNDLPVAEKLYRSVAEIDVNNAIVYNNLAWITGKLKKDGAIKLAEKANTLAPNQPAYMDTLAMLLSEKDDYAKALEWQNKAVALEPQNPAYKLNLAKIHINGGKKDLARKELDELAKLGDKFRGQAEVAVLIKSL